MFLVNLRTESIQLSLDQGLSKSCELPCSDLLSGLVCGGQA